MAYWQFDLTFTNLGALPAGAGAIGIYTILSGPPWPGNLSSGAPLPATGDLDFTLSTLSPSYGDPFELPPETKVWFEVTVLTEAASQGETLDAYLIGPYTVGEVGTETAPEL